MADENCSLPTTSCPLVGITIHGFKACKHARNFLPRLNIVARVLTVFLRSNPNHLSFNLRKYAASEYVVGGEITLNVYNSQINV